MMWILHVFVSLNAFFQFLLILLAHKIWHFSVFLGNASWGKNNNLIF